MLVWVLGKMQQAQSTLLPTECKYKLCIEHKGQLSRTLKINDSGHIGTEIRC